VGDKGTARWRGVGTIDKEIAFACDKVVITAEEIVPEAEMRKEPEANQIPFFTLMPLWKFPGVPFQVVSLSIMTMTHHYERDG